MRRPYEGSFFVCRGEACLALSPHARLLIEGDACVAPTKVWAAIPRLAWCFARAGR
jgi:hypothetical protein